MELWLFRHGYAKAPADWLGEDFDRPLTDEGRRIFADEAREIATLENNPRLILASPAERCQETAAILADALGDVSVKTAPWLLIETPLRRIISELAKHTEKRLAVITHQPEVQALYAHYTKAPEGMIFAPGQWCHLSV